MDERPVNEGTGPEAAPPWNPPPTDPPVPPLPPGGPPPGEPPAPPAPDVIPWEDPSRPWTAALGETIRLLVGRPRAAFERVPVSGDVLRPVLFAILLGSIGLFFSGMWELTVNQAVRGMFPATAWGQSPEASRASALVSMLFGPLLCAVGLLAWTVLTHGALMLVGGARNGLAATLRALAYAQVASLALILPFCGGMFAMVWSIVLDVIGISALHRISTGKAVVAVFLPLLLCCGCAAAVFALFSAAIVAGLQGMAH